MAAPLVTREMCERRIGVLAWARLTGDQGADEPDDDTELEILEEATDRAIGLLWNGFPSEEQIRNLVEADKSVRGMLAKLAVGLAGERRPHLINDQGKPLYDGWTEKAERVLAETAEGKRRAKGEGTAGRNAMLKASTNVAPPERKTIFVATKDDPKGPGGF